MIDEKTTPPTLATVVDASLQELDLGIAIMPQPGEVAKMDYKELHRLKLLELAKQVDALPDITDAKAYEVNQKKRTELVGTRTGLDRRRKELFAPLRALKEEVDGYIGTTPDAGLQGQVKALERRIEAKQEVWKAKQEEIRQAALRIIEERNEARARRMVEAGMEFNGSAYVLMDLRVFPVDINGLDDAAFEAWWDGVLGPALIAKGEADRIAEEARQNELARIEQKRKDAEEQERQQRETFERQAREQKRLDDERAQLDREREAIRQQKNEHRATILLGLGAEQDPRGFYHVGGDLIQILSDLASLSDEDWQLAQEGVKRQKVVLDLRNTEAQRRNELNRDRALVLLNIGAERDEAGTWTLGNATTTDHLLGTMSDEDWLACQTAFEAEERSLKLEDDMLEKEREESRPPGVAAEDVPGLSPMQQDAIDQAFAQTIIDEVMEHPLNELLACALALLDEANKIASVPVEHNEDYVRCADRVINVIGPLVADIRSTIKTATA